MSPLSWIALVLIGAAGPPPGSGCEIATEVRVLELGGLDWRSTVDSKLDLVARQGGAAIWTGRREVLPELMKVVQKDRSAQCYQAPKVTSRSDDSCVVTTKNPRPHRRSHDRRRALSVLAKQSARTAMPAAPLPMLCTLVAEPFDNPA